MTAARIAITTAGSRDEAERIARTLVEERLAACVNIVDNIHSIYRWQGKVESAAEWLLLIKTDQPHLDALRARIADLHSYELPEFLVLDVADSGTGYLDWITSSLR